MKLNITREVAALQMMTPKQLQARYLEVYGEPARSGNKDYLWKRIIWRMQSLAEGDLTERARRRAAELANDADLRIRRPTDRPQMVAAVTVPSQPSEIPSHDPPKDSLLEQIVRPKPYKGRRIVVTPQTNGFEYEGRTYPSLSAVAQAITGSHWSGNRFFGLTDKDNR